MYPIIVISQETEIRIQNFSLLYNGIVQRKRLSQKMITITSIQGKIYPSIPSSQEPEIRI